MKHNVSFLFFFLSILCIEQSQAQTSATYRYDDIKGDSIHTVVHEKNNLFITCSHTSDSRSCFLVESLSPSIKKKFYTTPAINPSHPHTTPLPQGCGLIINDLETVQDYECWFCGQRWEQTGYITYNPYGVAVPETIFCGFVGRFNINNAISGSGNVEIMTIPGTINLEHLAVSTGNIITVTESSQLIELTPTSTGYNYIIGRSTHPSEVFMDAVTTNDTVVLLSRFSNPQHYFYHHDMFALRYALPSTFVTSCDSFYRYDTYYINNDHSFGFDTLSPIMLCRTNNACGVVVAYITPREDYREFETTPGKLVLHHIAKKNSDPIEIIKSNDNNTYVCIKDLEACSPVIGNTFIAALLEDSLGKSVLRYPILQHTYTYLTDTIRRISNVRLQSLAPYHNPTTSVASLYAAGYYPANQKKLAKVYDYTVHMHNKEPLPKECFLTSYGTLQYATDKTIKLPYNFSFQTMSTGSVSFTTLPYSAVDTSPVTTCLY